MKPCAQSLRADLGRAESAGIDGKSKNMKISREGSTEAVKPNLQYDQGVKMVLAMRTKLSWDTLGRALGDAPLDRQPEAGEKESKGGAASTQRQASKLGSEPVGLDVDEEAVKEEEGDVGESFDEAGDKDCIAVEAGKTHLAVIGTTKGEAVPEGPGSDDDASGDFESGSSEEDGEDAESSESGMEATEISVEGAPAPQGYKGNAVFPITGLVDSGPYNAVACIGSGLDFVNVDKMDDMGKKDAVEEGWTLVGKDKGKAPVQTSLDNLEEQGKAESSHEALVEAHPNEKFCHKQVSASDSPVAKERVSNSGKEIPLPNLLEKESPAQDQLVYQSESEDNSVEFLETSGGIIMDEFDGPVSKKSPSEKKISLKSPPRKKLSSSKRRKKRSNH
ncbi:hypothetical protein U1Q18_032706 [Sarracenia purpurea var. burkii]